MTINPGSFRDPAGFVFTQQGRTLRQVNRSYAKQYDHLMESGLYERLGVDRMLIRHKESGLKYAISDDAYRIIQPRQLPFTCYPYEWSFSQWKAAALHTLQVQMIAMEYGMTLKDASAYNIQFVGGKPILIDTLSFDLYEEGQVWIPYRQFIEQFLAPLALMATVDINLGQLLRIHLDGIPTPLASALLPMRTRVNFGLATHIHMHARGQKAFAGRSVDINAPTNMDRKAFVALIDNLIEVITSLNWKVDRAGWVDYYTQNVYEEESFRQKEMLIRGFLGDVAPRVVWDLGANTGYFSRIANEMGAYVVSFDADPAVVEVNYQQVQANNEERLLPLIMDLANPSPGLGWANVERRSFASRANADLVLALALVHHLAISHNIPLNLIASYFARLAPALIIEFVPKTDPMAIALLNSRHDIFEDYTREGFEAAFAKHFDLVQTETIKRTGRILYLLRRRDI